VEIGSREENARIDTLLCIQMQNRTMIGIEMGAAAVGGPSVPSGSLAG
jgi:hypothetical protein